MIWKLICVLILEHLVLFLKVFLAYIINDVPDWIVAANARSDFLNRRWRLECELKAVRLQAAARGNLARSKLRESEAALQSSLDALLTSNVEHLDDEAEQWAATTQEREGASSWTARVKEAREYSRALQAKELVVRRALRKLDRELQHLSATAQKDAKRQQRQLQHEMAAITAELETVTRVTREAVQEQITLRSGARHHACADVERAVVRVQRLWRRKVGARAVPRFVRLRLRFHGLHNRRRRLDILDLVSRADDAQSAPACASTETTCALSASLFLNVSSSVISPILERTVVCARMSIAVTGSSTA